MAPAPAFAALRRPALGAALLCACFAPSGSDPTTTDATSTAGTTTTGATTSAPPTSTSTSPTSGSTAPTTGTANPDQGSPDVPCAPVDATDLELGTAAGFVMLGEIEAPGAGVAVTGIGDFDGDTHDDVRVLSLPRLADSCATTRAWNNYFVFGKPDTNAVGLSSEPLDPFVLTNQGLFVDGTDACDPQLCENRFGAALASLGNFDAGPRADVVVGAPGANVSIGRVYVLHGRERDGTFIHAAAAAASVLDFVFDGLDNQFAGINVTGLGDVDGDLVPDLAFLVGGPSPAIYVVYGMKPPMNPFPLGGFMPPTQGYRIDDPDGPLTFGTNLQGGHDFNGDGVPDLLLTTEPDETSRVVIVFGNKGRNQNSAALDAFVADQRTTTLQCGATCGTTARFVGDINGDGLADVAAGMWEADAFTGRVAVVFGAATPRVVDLANLAPSDGFVVDGESGADFFGYAVAGADVDGDGVDDLVVGAPGHDNSRGRVYVAFGRPALHGFAPDDIAAGLGGFVIDGAAGIPTMLGFSVARAGHVDDDDIDDLIVGAPGVAPGSCDLGAYPGRAYVIFGRTCGR